MSLILQGNSKPAVSLVWVDNVFVVYTEGNGTQPRKTPGTPARLVGMGLHYRSSRAFIPPNSEQKAVLTKYHKM